MGKIISWIAVALLAATFVFYAYLGVRLIQLGPEGIGQEIGAATKQFSKGFENGKTDVRQ